jgi:NADPH-dependent curcumin reductase CurA
MERIGFDATVNYKAVRDVGMKVAQKCRGVINVYFDNVGGEMLHSIMQRMENGKGEVIACGRISHYKQAGGDGQNVDAPSFDDILLQIIGKGLRVSGFQVSRDPTVEDRKEAFAEIESLIRDGKLIVLESVFDGLDSFGEALSKLLMGATVGKTVLKI